MGTTYSSAQIRFLKGQAHALKPLAYVGKNGVTDAFIAEVGAALETHELIKVKFNEFKEDRLALSEKIAHASNAEIVGRIGNTVILFRQHRNKKRRKIRVPLV